MSTDGTILITNTGHARLNEAVNTKTSVAISHVALGDGGGAVYDPGYGQSALKRELARVAITSRHIAGDDVWSIKAEFDADTTATFFVREIGFFDSTGDLIFIWAGADIDPRQTGAIDYLIDQAFNLDRVRNGLVIVDAPDDDTFDLAVATGIALADLQLEQLRQADRIRTEHGAY